MGSPEGGLKRRDFLKRALSSAATAIPMISHKAASAEKIAGFVDLYDNGKLDGNVIKVLKGRGFEIEDHPEMAPTGNVLIVKGPEANTWIAGKQVRGAREEHAFYMDGKSTLMLSLTERETILRNEFNGKVQLYRFPNVTAQK